MKGRSFFVFSGEHPELARDEAISIARTYDPETECESDSRLLITRSTVRPEKLAARATFVRFAGTIAGPLGDVSSFEIPDLQPTTFACKTLNLSSSMVDARSLERDAGGAFKQRTGSKVSLSNPDLMLYLIITDNGMHLGYSHTTTKPKRPVKPLKYPHELGWKLARCMINLAGLREHQSVCDPFCGTGTILLEAASMGVCTVGIDFDPRMCRISEKNMAKNGYEARIINGTYSYLRVLRSRVDAVVTDLPYGTSSRSSLPPRNLIRDFLSTMPKETGLVMVCKKGSGEEEFGWKKKYEIFRHKSLTRVIVVR